MQIGKIMATKMIMTAVAAVMAIAGAVQTTRGPATRGTEQSSPRVVRWQLVCRRNSR
jgi:hypothetical protein